MQLSQVPTKFPIPWGSSAGSGFIRSVPTASQVGIQNGAASLTDGFPPLNFLPVGSGGVPPFGQDMNGILNQITLWNQWNGAGGLCLYDSVFSADIGGYPKGAILASSTAGQIWLNTVDNNTSNPDASGTGWAGLTQTAIVHAGTDSSASGNTITVSTVSPPVSSVLTNMVFEITKSAHANTGAITATIAGTTGSVIWADGTALSVTNGFPDWPASTPALLSFDGTNFRIQSVMGPTVFARLGSIPIPLTGATSYYVNGSTGNDSNNGTSSLTPFATIQHAITIVSGLNLNGQTVTINVADGTYAPITLVQAFGAGSIIILGDTVTPANTVIAASSGSAVTGPVGAGSQYTINSFKLTSAAATGGDPGAGVWLSGSGTSVSLQNINFGTCKGAHVMCGQGAEAVLSGALVISGGLTANSLAPGACFFSTANSTIVVPSTNPSITISMAITVAYFAYAQINANLQVVFSSITGATNITGQKYLATLNGVISTSGAGTSYYPGSVSGATSAGGQYA
jgi:hypothetical protein